MLPEVFTFTHFNALLNAVMLGLGAWAFRRFVGAFDTHDQKLDSVSDKVSLINGRIGKLEVGLEAHIKQDDDRFATAVRERESLARAIGRRKDDA